MSERPATAPQRPSSAQPNTRVRLRQYNHLVQQLKNTVAETKRPPPAGADIEAIAARRTKLERVLRDVQESIAAAKVEQKEEQDSRWRKAVTDQQKKEERIYEACKAQEKRSAQNSKEYWNFTMGRRKAKNEQLEKRTDQAFQYLEDAHDSRVKHNWEMTENRNTKLRQMEAHQAQVRAESARRRDQIRQHTNNLYQRKLDHDAERARLADEDAKQKREQWEHKNKLHEDWKKKRSQSASTHRAVALKRGTFDHAKALQEQEEREKKQFLRYQQEEAIRAAERARKKQLSLQRDQKREENYTKISDGHLNRNDQIKQSEFDRDAYVRDMKDQLHSRMDNSRKNRNITIASHQAKAASRRDAKINDAFQSNYNRWTRRADHVMSKIIGSYEALNSGPSVGGDTESGEQALHAASTRGGGDASSPPVQSSNRIGRSGNLTASPVGSPSNGGSSIRKRLPSQSNLGKSLPA